MGIVGAIVISRWSWALIRDTGSVLLDRVPHGENLEGKIRTALERKGDVITDLHLWQVGHGQHSVFVAIASTAPKSPLEYKSVIQRLVHVAHITLEVHKLDAAA